MPDETMKPASDSKPFSPGLYYKLRNEMAKGKSRARKNVLDEILWAQIFSSTIRDSEWLRNKSFSPGMWAAGFPFLYLLYRVLRDAKPKIILELGLGETTRMISQYCATHLGVRHFVAENDPDWISFFSKSCSLTANTDIVTLPLALRPYRNSKAVRVYDGFAERFANEKYNLICIDGPLGGDMERYARIDALDLIPDSLSETFTILVDDYNRSPERNMTKDLLRILNKMKIPYAWSIYSGIKRTAIICSEDNKFLTTLM